MSEYQNQDVDFIKRTLCLIDQYEKFKIQKDEKYETTLFVNCMLGLLIIPKQKLFKKLDYIKEPIENWGIEKSQINSIGEGETINISKLIQNLRDSLSHYLFECYYHEGKIQGIIFRNKKNGKCNFLATIPISCLKTFTIKLAKYYLQELSQDNIT